MIFIIFFNYLEFLKLTLFYKINIVPAFHDIIFFMHNLIFFKFF